MNLHPIIQSKCTAEDVIAFIKYLEQVEEAKYGLGEYVTSLLDAYREAQDYTNSFRLGDYRGEAPSAYEMYDGKIVALWKNGDDFVFTVDLLFLPKEEQIERFVQIRIAAIKEAEEKALEIDTQITRKIEEKERLEYERLRAKYEGKL